MEIREERNWIEVRVDRKEMRGYGLTFEALEPGSQKMERMMGEILSRVWEETELDLFHSGLQIRAFPLDGGCRLFLKRKRGQKHRRREAEPVAADFESWADLCRGAELLREKGVRRMAIYRMPEGWRLLLWGKDSRELVRTLPGGRYAGRGVLFQAAAVEFGEPFPYRREAMAAEGSEAPKT